MRNLSSLPFDQLDALPRRAPIRKPSPPSPSYASMAELDDIRLLDRLTSGVSTTERGRQR
jgi:hypothetical protein